MIIWSIECLVHAVHAVHVVNDYLLFDFRISQVRAILKLISSNLHP
jgi:hypothetical protein